jgi:predicted ester cyclase
MLSAGLFCYGAENLLLPSCPQKKERNEMTVKENKALIRRFVEEVYNRQDLDYSEFVHQDIPENAVEHLQEFFTAFQDSHTTLLDLIAEGDKVVGRLHIAATNTGPFAGQPPTGKQVEFQSIRIYRIADHKIAESWAMQDRLGLMEQLGFVRSAGEVNWSAGEDDLEVHTKD